MSRQQNALVASVMPLFAPPPDLTVSQWAERNRRLPASSASRGARWNNATAPYLVEIQDSLADPSVRRVVVMGAHQTGKSESAHNALGYWIEHDPSTLLWLMPSFEDAKRRSRGALADMIRSTPSLRALVRGRRAPRDAHENESTLLEKVYPNGSLILAGSGTPNSYAGISARRAVADEFERFAELDEGAPDVLMTNRTTSFYDGLTAFFSTPLLKDGKIDAQFQTTDQRRYCLICPDCGREDWVTWQDPVHFSVTYQDRDPETARLTCPCGAQHDEPMRRRMVAGGRWRPTVTPVDPAARGYHLPATVSTLGDVSLSNLVRKWLIARASGPAALLAFVTTSLAEPWEDRGSRSDPQALAAKLEAYGPGVDVPAAVIALTAGVDVQINRFEVTVVGWGHGNESWVVASYDVPGDPTNAEVQAALLTALDDTYKHESGASIAIRAVGIDSGFLPDRVAYPLAAKRPRRFFAVKGVGGRFGEPSILKFVLHEPPVVLNVDGLKLEIALGMEMEKPGPGYLHLSRAVCDEEFLAQLCAEHRETTRRKGVATLIWVEDRAANHALDCLVYARAALKLLVKVSGARTEEVLLDRLAALGLGPASPPPSAPRPKDPPSGSFIPKRPDWIRGRR